METETTRSRRCRCQNCPYPTRSRSTEWRCNVCAAKFLILNICRWIDQFTKLHLWSFTEYERIVYMDSDLLPLVNTEELFSIELNQQSMTHPPYNYSFAAVPTLGGKITDDEGEIEL